MNISRTIIVHSTVLIILLVTVISGPVVSGVDFTTTKDPDFIVNESSFDRGSIEVIGEPTGPVVLDRGEFGNDAYRLLAPPMQVQVVEVQGTPRITYKIRIEELGYARLTTYFLSEQSIGGTLTLSMTEDFIKPSKVTKQEYHSELLVTVHDDTGDTVVYRTNASVVVKD